MRKLFFQQKSDIFALILILITSVLTVIDLLVNIGQSANMDGIVHTLTPALFSDAIKMGDFPVTWVDRFGNYGLPLGIIAHQFTTYLTAFINLVVNNPVLAFNIVALIGIILSNIFYYLFLRFYFQPIYAFLGVFLFNFAPYRIMNLYMRGAMPEFFASVFISLTLIGLYLFVHKRNIYGFFLITLSIALLVLTHPFMFIVSAFLFVPYALFLFFSNGSQKIKLGISVCAAFILGLGIVGFYLIPLIKEIMYFYYANVKNHLVANNYLNLKNYFDPQWYYVTNIDLFHRGFVVNVGVIETASIVIGFIYFILKMIRQKLKLTFTIFEYALFTGLLIAFFTTKYSDIFYQHINVLSGIQFPWRMLSALLFIPPIIAAYFLSKSNRKTLVLLLVFIIAIMRFPQLYGKNYVNYPENHYHFTPYNLHATIMNTIWSGKTEDYPVREKKSSIIAGKGTIEMQKYSFSQRKYLVRAQTPLSVADYTFYFPGWHVYVDGKDTYIEFQDTNNRGIITYNVPAGKHSVVVKFEDTGIRKISKAIASFFFGMTVLLFIFRKKFSNNIFAKEKK